MLQNLFFINKYNVSCTKRIIDRFSIFYSIPDEDKKNHKKYFFQNINLIYL